MVTHRPRNQCKHPHLRHPRIIIDISNCTTYWFWSATNQIERSECLISQIYLQVLTLMSRSRSKVDAHHINEWDKYASKSDNKSDGTKPVSTHTCGCLCSKQTATLCNKSIREATLRLCVVLHDGSCDHVVSQTFYVCIKPWWILGRSVI